ncbi:hypothetical protein [Roseomonas elaeocarpi]|uniref:4Fe-4S ferredoxin-type domain-containing protein n=1 Tax=Roseomonas elaeocarpi TaxID=907779 RepID=A0ABV6JM01_9PROT
MMDGAAQIFATLRGIRLACPKDGRALEVKGAMLRCCGCGTACPVAGGVPVLIDDDRSASADYSAGARAMDRRFPIAPWCSTIAAASASARNTCRRLMRERR